MANERKIEIIIAADGSLAISELGKVTQSMKQMESSSGGIVSSLKSHWLAISATVAGALVTISKAWDLAERAAKYEEQRASLNSLAGAYGQTADQIVSGIEKASHGLINLQDATRIAGEGLMKYLKPDQIINLAGAAKILESVTGEKVPEAFERFVTSIAAGRERAIKLAIGIIDLKAKYGALADQMSESQKAAALYEMFMEKIRTVQAQLGKEIDSTADKMERLRVTVQNLQLTMGTILLRIGAGAAGVFYFYAAAVYTAEEALAKIAKVGAYATDALGITSGAVEKMAQHILESQEGAKEAEKKYNDFFSVLFSKSSDITAVTGKIKGFGEGMATSSDKAREAMMAWQTKIENLNPLLEQSTREINSLWEEAEKLRIQFGNKSWITEGLAKGLEFLSDKQVTVEKKRADEIALAYAQAAQSELEARISVEDKINQYRLKAGGMTETEAITKQYEGQRLILEGKQRQLIIEMQIADTEAQRTKDWSKFIELSGQYYDIAKQIEATEKYEAFELADVYLNKLKKQNDLIKQRLDMTKEQYAEAWGGMMDIANQISGQYGQGLGQIFGGVKGQMDIAAQMDPFTQRLDKMREMYMQYFADQKMIAQQEVELWKQKERDKQQIEVESLLKRFGMEKEVDNLRLQETYAIEQQKLSMNLYTLQMIQGALTYFAAFSGKQNKVMFALSKAVGIAIIWVQTQIAAMSAAAAVAGIPIVGPALAAAAYSKMQILGYISMAAAAAAAIGQMAGGGAMGGMPSGGGGYKYTSPTTPSWEKTTEEKPRPLIQNIYIYSDVIDNASLDTFARKLIPSINKGYADGVH